MKVYLAEIVKNGRLEPIGVFQKKAHAKKAIGENIGLITEMELNTAYYRGIGVLRHWHINDSMAFEITL